MKKTMTTMLALILMVSIAIPAFAADQAYYFNLTVEDAYRVYTATSNQKVIRNDDATIKCTETNAQGYGYRMGLCYDASNSYLMATEETWMKTGRTRNVAYFDNDEAFGNYFHAYGRIDDDYYGPFEITGYYNADET